ncbi:hypothetical protein ANN_19429 [Periplaneta americana]|uniref:Uncharacterized protein n=1 Tax=Periplaneta americana TaxID=6978 RepID=A0ABQ8SA84_PERAM|nr:hypothetical protein ANN_19429 [Periplaneta americana]
MSPVSSTESYPAFARIGLRENPGKNLNQVTCPDRDSNPGHLVSRPHALTVAPQPWTEVATVIICYSCGIVRLFSPDSRQQCAPWSGESIKLRLGMFRRLRWAGHVARMDESRSAYRVLVARPEGKSPLGGPRRRWEDNIKMDLREVGYDDRDWINLAQDRDQGGNEPPGSLKARGSVRSTIVPEFSAFRNISARINSLRSLPRAFRHLGSTVGMDPVLLGHLGSVNLERGRVGGPY